MNVSSGDGLQKQNKYYICSPQPTQLWYCVYIIITHCPVDPPGIINASERPKRTKEPQQPPLEQEKGKKMCIPACV